MKSGSDGAAVRNGIAELTFIAEEQHPEPRDQLELVCTVTYPQRRYGTYPRRIGPAGTSGVSASLPAWLEPIHIAQRAPTRRMSACMTAAGVIEVTEYTGSNPLFRHGPHSERRWAASRACRWHPVLLAWAIPGGWPAPAVAGGRISSHTLIADRVKKGFTVVQLVAGLFPEMPPFHASAANEGGFAWPGGYGEINPAFFDAFDLKLACLCSPVSCHAWSAHGDHTWIMPASTSSSDTGATWSRGTARIRWCGALQAKPRSCHLHEFWSTARTMAAAIASSTTKLGRGDAGGAALDPYHRLITVHPCPVATYRSSQVLQRSRVFSISKCCKPVTRIRNCFDSTLLPYHRCRAGWTEAGDQRGSLLRGHLRQQLA